MMNDVKEMLSNDKYHCSAKSQMKTLKRKANESEESQSDNIGVPVTKQRLQNSLQGVPTKTEQSKSMTASKNPYAAPRQRMVSDGVDKQRRLNTQLQKKRNNLMEIIARLQNLKDAICSVLLDSASTYDIKNDLLPKQATVSECEQSQIPHRSDIAAANQHEDDQYNHLSASTSNLNQLNPSFDWIQGNCMSFKFLSFTKYRNAHENDTDACSSSSIITNPVSIDEAGEWQKFEAVDLQKMCSEYIFILDPVINVDDGEKIAQEQSGSGIDANKSAEQQEVSDQVGTEKSTIKHQLLLFLKNPTKENAKLSYYVTMFLAFVAYECFEYNPRFKCHVLKRDLWGIHQYMLEFYIFLLWQLEELKDEKKLQDDFRKNLKTNKKSFLVEVIKLMNENKIELSVDNIKIISTRYIAKEKAKYIRDYKLYLGKLVRNLSDILSRYKKFKESIDNGNQNDTIQSNITNLFAVIYDIRKLTRDHLQRFYKEERIDFLYSTIENLPYKKIEDRIDGKKANMISKVTGKPKTKVKTPEEKEEQKLKLKKYFEQRYSAEQSNKIIENSYKNATFLIVFICDLERLDVKGYYPACTKEPNQKQKQNKNPSNILYDNILKRVASVSVLQKNEKKIKDFFRFIGREFFNVVDAQKGLVGYLTNDSNSNEANKESTDQDKKVDSRIKIKECRDSILETIRTITA